MKTKIKSRQWVIGLSLIICHLSFSLALTSCQKDWEDPVNIPYGNNNISEENIITIAELKALYPNVFASTDANK